MVSTPVLVAHTGAGRTTASMADVHFGSVPKPIGRFVHRPIASHSPGEPRPPGSGLRLLNLPPLVWLLLVVEVSDARDVG